MAKTEVVVRVIVEVTAGRVVAEVTVDVVVWERSAGR